MNWLELWAQIEIILTFIGLGLLALIILSIIIGVIVAFSRYYYKSHSKKYKWDFNENEYVKKKKGE